MKHIIVASVLVIVVTALLILGLSALDLVPQLASQEGALVDQMFRVQIYIIAFLFSLIVVLMLYSVVVFRRKPEDTSDGPHIKGNTPLEITWTLIPLAVVIGMGIWGAGHLYEITAPDPNELVVEVTGFQFGWRFDYPEYGFSSSDLYLPLDRQILFKLTSTDVIHSFWVPEFRIKQDAVPGRWTTLRVTPTETGDYRIRCAEMCGYAHSVMYAPVVVVQPDQFEAWLDGQEVAAEPSDEMTMAEKGAELVALQGCGGCHSLDGSDSVGPTWLDLYGQERPMEDGSVVNADRVYLRNAILDPASQVVAGYPMIMPVYEGVLSEEDVEAMIEYIASLHE
ncbi:cytochrome c oxidase subunit II [Chloroflexota bacterium]